MPHPEASGHERVQRAWRDTEKQVHQPATATTIGHHNTHLQITLIVDHLQDDKQELVVGHAQRCRTARRNDPRRVALEPVV